MKTTSAVHPLRMRRFEGNVRDPYLVPEKLRSPTLCPECHAVFERGHWRWEASTRAISSRQICPACRRIRDRYPAGWVALSGVFVKGHRQQVLDIVHSEENKEIREHPLNRIMRIEERRDGLLITTTDVHLPRLIGAALRRAHKGELHVRYDTHGYAARVEWRREA